MIYIAYLFILFIGLILTFFLTRFFRYLALKTNFIDKPSQRKFHKTSTPLLGGAGIFIGFWITIFVSTVVIRIFPAFASGTSINLSWIIYIFSGSLIISTVGLWDDKFVIKPKQKLFFQFIVALLTVFAGIRIKLFLPDFLSALLTIIWILAITNAFNLLDNMDGVSTGIALICSFILFIVSVVMKNYFISFLLSAFMGVLGGFLLFNFPPASIFMGDCGSLFIGYIISIVTILGTYYKPTSPTFFPVVIPLLILAVPLFDIFSVMWIRTRQGKSIFHADKNHFSHRLVNMGMNVKSAVGFLYLLTFCAGIPAVILPTLSLSGVLIVFFQTVVIMLLIAMLEHYGKKN